MSYHFVRGPDPGSTTVHSMVVGADGKVSQLQPGQIAPAADTEMFNKIASSRPGGGYIALSVNAKTTNISGAGDKQVIRVLSPQGEVVGSYEARNRHALLQNLHVMYVPLAAAYTQGGQLGTLTLTLSQIKKNGTQHDLPQLSVAFPINELTGGQVMIVEKIGQYTGWVVNGQPQMERIMWTILCSDQSVDHSSYSDADMLRTIRVSMRGEKLPKVDTFGSIDPFIIVERPVVPIAPGVPIDPKARATVELYRSEGFTRNPNPTFKDCMIGSIMLVSYGRPDTVISFRLMDMNLTGDTYVGEAQITLSELLSGSECCLDLHSKKEKREKQIQKCESKLYVRGALVDTPEAQAAEARLRQPPLNIRRGGEGPVMEQNPMTRSRKMTMADAQKSILSNYESEAAEPVSYTADVAQQDLSGNIDDYLEAMKTNPGAMQNPDLDIDYESLWAVPSKN